MTRASDLVLSLSNVNERILEACDKCGRNVDDVTLVAVSKTCGSQDVQALYDVGHRDFGENYVQEWEEKADELPDDVRWHFIGGLQSRKAKQVVNRVELIQGVDRESLVEAISKRATRPQKVLIQINTGNDEAKGGVDPGEALSFFERSQALENVTVVGLMTIPPFDAEELQLRRYFAQMRDIFETLKSADPRVNTLSMGMTSDFEWAIEEGATMIRVGTAIFGARSTT
jgi:pyridoxal phosphate enzyme (YggS family)